MPKAFPNRQLRQISWNSPRSPVEKPASRLIHYLTDNILQFGMFRRSYAAREWGNGMATITTLSSQMAIPLRQSLLLLLGFMILLSNSGCGLKNWAHNDFKVGPNYRPFMAPVSEEWIDYADPRIASEEQDLSEWWRSFNDPALDRLIEIAYQQNLSLRVAGARIEEARALRRFAAGTLFPQSQSIDGSYSRIKTPAPVSSYFDQWNTDLNLSWELDFWGRYRRAIEAADGELDASVENYDDVLVILLAEVASNYVSYRTFEQRLIYAEGNVTTQSASLKRVEFRNREGAVGVTERDIQQSRQVLEQTQAAIPLLKTGQRQANNALCALLGMPPRELTDLLAGAKVIPTAPLDVAVGIPADLLRRRPDVRRAERLAAAQCARIGIATSEFYPRFAISGNLGASSENLSQLFDFPESMAASITPSFQWSILNYGRLRSSVQVQDARFVQLATIYQDSVLQAGREAENSLYGFLQSQDRAKFAAASADAAKKALDVTNKQYTEGAVDYTPVFLFQGTLAQTQDQLAVAQGDVALNLIRLYRALGGGWNMRLIRDQGMHIYPPSDGPAPNLPEELPPPPNPAPDDQKN